MPIYVYGYYLEGKKVFIRAIISAISAASTVLLLSFNLCNAEVGWITYSSPEYDMFSNSIYNIAIDPNDNIWFCSLAAGLSKYSGSEWTTFSTSDGLPYLYSHAIAIDSSGNVWLGHSFDGITKWDGKESITFTSHFNGISDDRVRAICADNSGNIWIGSLGAINKYDGQTWATFHPNDYNGLDYTGARSILYDSGNIWFGLQGGLAKFDGQTWQTYSPSLGNVQYQYMNDIAIDSKGNIWCGTDAGLCMWNGQVWQSFSTPLDGYSENEIWAVAIDKQDNLWVGLTWGLAKYDGSEWITYTTENGLPENDINDIAVDSKGNIWVGTQSMGICKYGELYPDIGVSQGSVSFGNVPVGDSTKVNIYVKNNGEGNLLIDSIYSENEVFRVTSISGTISPKDSLSVEVLFRPSSEGFDSSAIKIVSNDLTKETIYLSVSGTGVVPKVYLTINYFDFGDVYIDSLATAMLTISNRGGALLNIDSITTNNTGIFYSDLTSFSLEPNRGKYINLNFSPKLETTYQDTLKIFSNAATAYIYLDGRGVEWKIYESLSGNIVFKSETENQNVWIELKETLEESSVIVHLIGNEDINGNEPIQCEKNGSIYCAKLPITEEGETVKYYFEIQDKLSNSYLIPTNAPHEYFKFSIAYPADVNDDGVTNIFDLLSILSYLKEPTGQPNSADINKDGTINIFDLLTLLQSLSAK